MPERPAVLRRHRVMLLPRHIGLGPDVGMIGHYDNVRADRMLHPHRHPELLEICYLARGRQVYHVGHRDYALHAGEIFITFPGEQHSTGGHPQEKGELFWLQVRVQGEHFLGLPARSTGPLMAALRRLPRRHFVGSSAVEPLFQRLIIAATARPHPLRQFELLAILLPLLLEVRTCAHRRGQSAITRDAPLQSLLDHIHSHLEQPPSIESMAQQLGLSPSWFKARFRRAMGMPPAQYVQRARIQRARALLAAGNSVTSVAMQLGFSSSQYFATVYRRFTDQPPSLARPPR